MNQDFQVQQAAANQGLEPHQLCDLVSANFRETFDRSVLSLHSSSSKVHNIWPRFGINYTDYIRTTEKRHAKAVGTAWQRLEVTFIYPTYLLKADIPRAMGTCIRQSTVAGTVSRMRLFFLKARYSFVCVLPELQTEKTYTLTTSGGGERGGTLLPRVRSQGGVAEGGELDVSSFSS